MSALTDLFTSFANKIRSKLGTSDTFTTTEMISAMDDIYDTGEAAGIATAKVGTAVAGDVLSGKTFTNSSTIEETGSMPNNGAVSPNGLNCGDSYTIPAGYHNGQGSVTANSLSSQTGVDSGKTAVTAGTMVSGYQGWVNGSKISGTFEGQTKSTSSSTSAQDITPDSGKYLTKVSVSAISPQRTAGTAATASGVDSTGPYVYFPYGWWPNSNTTYGCYTRMTNAQAVAACRQETKTVTSSVSAQTVTPTSGYLLSKVTVNALTMSGTFNASTTRSTAIDMGASNTYRYVNTNSVSNTNSSTYNATTRSNSTGIDLGATNTYRYVRTDNVPNSNSGTYTPTSNSSAADMGASNTYRYVNTNTVYNSGVLTGRAQGSAVRLTCCCWDTSHGTIQFTSVYPKSVTIGKSVYSNGSYQSGDVVEIYNSSGTKVKSVACNTSGSYTSTSNNIAIARVYINNPNKVLKEVYAPLTFGY